MNKLKALSNDVFKNKNIVEHKKLWFTVPIVILFIAIVVFCSFWIASGYFSGGMNLGIDFTGGSIISVALPEAETQDAQFAVNAAAIEQIIQNNLGSPSTRLVFDDGARTGIQIRYTFADTTPAHVEAQNALIRSELAAYFNIAIEDVALQHIGAAASAQLITSALLALGVALVIILVYIAFRFQLWSGIAAIIGQFHDVMIMFALVIIFRVQMNTNFVAALITIAAYSTNNTVVVFDRVRENIKKNEDEGQKQSVSQVVNKSLSQTLRRSINTTVTTLFSILLLAIIGVPSIREFAIPVIFGLIAGFYSSLLIAPSLYVVMFEANERRKKRKASMVKDESAMEKEGGKLSRKNKKAAKQS